MTEPRYSLLRALRTQLENLPRAPELNTSHELAERSNRVARGLLIPSDALDDVERRDLTTDEFNKGGALVVPGTILGNPVEALRPTRWSVAAGVREVSGLEGTGSVVLPFHAGVGSVGWVDGVAEEVPKSDERTGQVALIPRLVGARSVIRRSLLKQAGLDVENWVRRMLRQSVDDAVDQAILQGSGVENEPLGLLGVPGVHSIALTTAGSPTRDEIIDTFAAAAKANANPGMLRFIGDSTLAQVLRKAKVETGDAVVASKGHSGGFVLEDGQLAKTAPCLETNHCPDKVLIAGDFSKVVVGRWSDPLDIVVDPFQHGLRGGVEVVVFAAVAVAQPKAFAVAE